MNFVNRFIHVLFKVIYYMHKFHFKVLIFCFSTKLHVSGPAATEPWLLKKGILTWLLMSVFCTGIEASGVRMLEVFLGLISDE